MHSDARDQRGAGGRLASLAIRNPVTICMVFLSIVVMGLIAVTRVPLMLMPSLDAPILFIRADYFNATPSQVLESITQPIEEAVAAVPGVQRLSSYSSSNGLSLQVFCGFGTDTSMLRTDIREKLDLIRDDLPDDLRQIEIHNFSTDEIPILEGSLTANRDLRLDYDFLEARVKRPLERIPGVGNVELWGTDRKQVDIYLRMNDIKRYRVDVGSLFRSLEGSNANLTLGQVSDGGQRYSAMARGTLESVDDIDDFPIGKQSLVLSDVADVVYDQRPRNSGRHQNGAPAVGLSIQKTSEANTVEVVDAVQSAFEAWVDDPTMDGLAIKWWHDSGKEIRNGIGELLKAGLIGSALAVLVLFLFLRRLDASLAVGLAIPFSVLTAIGFLYFYGGTLNILSMMGLMLAAGMLVDNAVVVLESILRRIDKGEVPRAAAGRGAGEVTLAVIAATSTTMIIFVPLMFDSESQLSTMLSHVGISIVFALLCSLFISLTLIPLAAARLFRSAEARGAASAERAVRWITAAPRYVYGKLRGARESDASRPLAERYLHLVDWTLDHRYMVALAIVPAILGASIWALVDLVPDNSPNATTVSSVRIEYEFSENYHYAKIERDFVTPVEEYLHANAAEFKVKSTSSGYGNGFAWSRLYFDVDTVKPEEVPGIRAALSEGLPVIPGAKIELGQEGGKERNWISANIYGEDPETLKALARQAKQELLDVDGFVEVFTDMSGARDEVRLQLRRDLARKYNISPSTVAQVLGITVRSRRMRSFRTASGETELWLGIDPADMQSLEDLEELVVGSGPGGEQILLGHVADLHIDRVPGRVTRDNRRTFTEIAAVFQGQRMEEGREEFKRILDGLPYEAGYGWSFGFWTNQMNDDAVAFGFSMLLAVVMVYFVMAALFESVLHPFAILLALPFSVVGIVGFLLVTGTPFNIMAQLGLIILIGIVVNNGIVLINHINNLRREGLARRAAILRGCNERLRAIVLTASTTVVGLIPLAWGDGNLMGMSYFPLARTVMGGLMASTVLTLIVLPVYYVVLDDLGRWSRRLWFASAQPVPESASGD